MAKIAENEPYLTLVTMEHILESAKNNSLYVDIDNLTEKQKKEKGIDDLPKELTPEILAKAT